MYNVPNLWHFSFKIFYYCVLTSQNTFYLMQMNILMITVVFLFELPVWRCWAMPGCHWSTLAYSGLWLADIRHTKAPTNERPGSESGSLAHYHHTYRSTQNLPNHMLKEKPYKGANKLWFHSFMIKSLRLTYLHFIEVTFVNDISISTQYKAYKDEMWLPTLSNIFPCRKQMFLYAFV